METLMILLTKFGDIMLFSTKTIVFGAFTFLALFFLRETYFFYKRGGARLYPKRAYKMIVTTFLFTLISIICFILFYLDYHELVL